jgi:hypothetical protein
VERNPWHTGSALRKLLPSPPTPGPGKSPVGPFALGDDEYVRELLEAAGYVKVEAVPYETTVHAPASAVVDPSLLEFMGVQPEHEEEALATLERHLSRFAIADGRDEYAYPLAFTVYEAGNP